jgi:hypothetical protein
MKPIIVAASFSLSSSANLSPPYRQKIFFGVRFLCFAKFSRRNSRGNGVSKNSRRKMSAAREEQSGFMAERRNAGGLIVLT